MCPQYNQYVWGNNPLNCSNSRVDIEELYLKPSDVWSIVQRLYNWIISCSICKWSLHIFLEHTNCKVIRTKINDY